MKLTKPLSCSNCKFLGKQVEVKYNKYHPNGQNAPFSFCEFHKERISKKETHFGGSQTVVCDNHEKG